MTYPFLFKNREQTKLKYNAIAVTGTKAIHFQEDTDESELNTVVEIREMKGTGNFLNYPKKYHNFLVITNCQKFKKMLC